MARCCAVINGEGIFGSLTFCQASEDAPTIIEGTIKGLSLGKHGMSIHLLGDFSEGFSSAGGIFNPFGRNHGSPDDEERMMGDLGNVDSVEEANAQVAHVNIVDRQVKLIGPHSIIGRSVVVHGSEDDMGRGGHELSLTTGNSGSRVAGGVIGITTF